VICILVLLPAAFGFAADITFTSDGVIQGGDVWDNVYVYDSPPDQTTVTMTGGEVTNLRLHDQCLLDRTGGEVGYIRALASSIANNYGSTTLGLFADDQAIINHHEGEVGFYVRAEGAGIINFYGGMNRNNIIASQQSAINLYGGRTDGWVYAYDSAVINVFGIQFDYDPTGAPGGQPLLTGSWLDHTPFSLTLADESVLSHINLVPEPATLMLSLAATVLIRRRGGESLE
jgi:hypothetical protein